MQHAQIEQLVAGDKTGVETTKQSSKAVADSIVGVATQMKTIAAQLAKGQDGAVATKGIGLPSWVSMRVSTAQTTDSYKRNIVSPSGGSVLVVSAVALKVRLL